MKKTILGILMIAIFAVAMMAGSVNATTVSASAAKIEKGQQVTVTVSSEKDVEGIQFVMHYKAANFKFVSAEAEGLTVYPNDDGNGNVEVISYGSTKVKNVTKLVFEATADTAEGEGLNFSVTDLQVSPVEVSDPLSTSAVKVEVGTTTPQPGETDPSKTNTTNPGETDPSKTNPTDNKTTTEEKTDDKVGTDGKAITKLPQAGTPVIAGAVVLVAIAGVIVAVKKFAK